jgi:hypothetical protein
MFDQAVRVDPETSLALAFGLEVRPDVHTRGVPPK